MSRLIPIFTVLLFPLASLSATVHVPGDQPTIQAGIDAAAEGDTVLVAAGTYTGAGNHDIDFAGVEITLLSASGPAATILDVQGSDLENRRGLYFHTGEGPQARVEGFTIQNGVTPRFGDMEWGAGILVELCAPTIVDCIFQDNRAWLGGGIHLESADPTIRGCTFRDNQAAYGGGVDMGGSAPLIEDCDFISNDATATGGALACRVGDDAIVRNCRFVGNSSPHGAALVTWASRPQFEMCLFTGSTGGSGVIKARQASALVFRSCTFAGNDTGQGVFVPRFETGFAPTIRLEHTIIAFNASGPAVDLLNDGADVTLECSDIFGNPGGDWSGLIAPQAGVDGNFSADPLFCDPDNGNLTLRSDSPCAPPGVTNCGLVGALWIGCGPVSVVEESWAAIKGKYR